jgi:hypothetical protein
MAGSRATRQPPLPASDDYFLARLRELVTSLRASVQVTRDAPRPVSSAAAVVRDVSTDAGYTGDTVYGIDARGEDALLAYCEAWARDLGEPFVLVAEGLPGDGRQVFPAGAPAERATFECIVDPIDGTRGLMYDKRSAWSLAAVAPGRALLGRRPTLEDVAVACQAELPTTRARLADTVWAVAGQGAAGETLDLTTGRAVELLPSPSTARTLEHGFATIAKFFPGTKVAASWLEERLFAEVVGEHAAGVPLVFDDEYIASGGQLYELLIGHDRFVADLRPALLDASGGTALATQAAHRRPPARRLCARPYDLCTALIAVEAGVAVTDEWGRPLAAPLDTTSDVAWAGYANEHLRALIEPVLQRLLAELGAPRR